MWMFRPASIASTHWLKILSWLGVVAIFLIEFSFYVEPFFSPNLSQVFSAFFRGGPFRIHTASRVLRSRPCCNHAQYEPNGFWFLQCGRLREKAVLIVWFL